MRRWMALFIAALCFTSTAFAQDAQLRRLESGADAAGWEAVGRLNIGGTGFCTGALIAPNLVLTAGHCLFDKKTGERIDHTRVEFLAGWRNGPGFGVSRCAPGRCTSRLPLCRSRKLKSRAQ